MPKPLMRGDEAFHVAPAAGIGAEGAAVQHHFKHMQNLLGDFEVALIASVMEGDKNLIGQAAAIARRARHDDRRGLENIIPGFAHAILRRALYRECHDHIAKASL